MKVMLLFAKQKKNMMVKKIYSDTLSEKVMFILSWLLKVIMTSLASRILISACLIV